MKLYERSINYLPQIVQMLAERYQRKAAQLVGKQIKRREQSRNYPPKIV